MIRRRKVDEGVYDVLFRDIVLGTVRYNPGAWSLGRWFIDGDRKVMSTSCAANGKQRKLIGCRTLTSAVNRITVMASGVIIKEICRS